MVMFWLYKAIYRQNSKEINAIQHILKKKKGKRKLHGNVTESLQTTTCKSAVQDCIALLALTPEISIQTSAAFVSRILFLQ